MTPDEAFSEAIRRIEAAIQCGNSSLILLNLPLPTLPPEVELLAELLQELHLGRFRVAVANDHELIYDLNDNEVPVSVRLDTSSLSRIAHLKNLKLLNMSGVDILGKISWISPLVKLESLHLQGPFTDISSLENLQRLRYLTIDWIRTNDLSPLKYLSDLRSLSVTGVPTNDLSPLKYLSELRRLSVAGDGVCELDSLANLKNLENLFVEGGTINDYGPLSKLTKLKTLTLSSDAQRDLKPLANLQQLETLTIRDGQITDLTPISNLSSLRRIFMQWGATSDIRPLISLPRLEEIYLQDCYYITEIPPELETRIIERTGV